MSDIGGRRVGRMFQLISIAINAEKQRLTELDGAIGDADHGISMSLGFAAVNNRLAQFDLDRALPSEIFAAAASSFLDAVGASTGPLYASAFRKAAQALQQNESMSCIGQSRIIEAMAAGIKERGKGQRGDKTMLDVWIPAAEAAATTSARGENEREMWDVVMNAAMAGAAATRSMVAVRGRASRLGERSLGHMDPGAASAVVILGAMKDAFLED
jgi:phosphoenolpyruvate---glycerone phosphotransferase subunit DhaL